LRTKEKAGKDQKTEKWPENYLPLNSLGKHVVRSKQRARRTKLDSFLATVGGKRMKGGRGLHLIPSTDIRLKADDRAPDSASKGGSPVVGTRDLL